jgi:hypothetical protein
MRATRTERRIDNGEIVCSEWPLLASLGMDERDDLIVESDESLSESLLQQEPGQVVGNSERFVAEDAVAVERAETLKAVACALGHFGCKVAVRNDLLLELGSVFGLQLSHRAEP